MTLTNQNLDRIRVRFGELGGARLSAMLGTGVILVAALLIWVPWASAQPVACASSTDQRRRLSWCQTEGAGRLGCTSGSTASSIRTTRVR
jgi:hypothetical protein